VHFAGECIADALQRYLCRLGGFSPMRDWTAPELRARQYPGHLEPWGE